MDINQDDEESKYMIYSFFSFCERGVGQGGRARDGVGRGVGANIFICDTLYQPVRKHVVLNFYQDIPYDT